MKIYKVDVCTNGCGVNGDYEYDHVKYFSDELKAVEYANSESDKIGQDVSVVEIEVVE